MRIFRKLWRIGAIAYASLNIIKSALTLDTRARAPGKKKEGTFEKSGAITRQRGSVRS